MSGRKESTENNASSSGNAEEFKSSIVVNYFSLFPPPENTSVWLDDLYQLKTRYLTTFHPFHQTLIKLIDAAVDFYTQTDAQFSKTRNEYIQDDEILDRMNRLAGALENCYHGLSNPELSVNERQVLHSAIVFCQESIEKRLEELQEANDRIYTLYNQQTNLLQGLINRTSEDTGFKKK